MPIYPYLCQSCGTEQDQFNHIATRDACPPCSDCGGATVRQLSAPMVSVPADVGYKCVVTGQVVTSERQRRNIMAEHRLVDANDFTPKYITDRKKAKTRENQRLAEQLVKDLPKEIASQATALAHADAA